MAENLDKIPTIILSHIDSSTASIWKNRETESYLLLLNKFKKEQIINAFSFLTANGIPPYGEKTREPLTFLTQNESLVLAFNIGYKPTEEKTNTSGRTITGPSELDLL